MTIPEVGHHQRLDIQSATRTTKPREVNEDITTTEGSSSTRESTQAARTPAPRGYRGSSTTKNDTPAPPTTSVTRICPRYHMSRSRDTRPTATARYAGNRPTARLPPLNLNNTLLPATGKQRKKMTDQRRATTSRRKISWRPRHDRTPVLACHDGRGEQESTKNQLTSCHHLLPSCKT